MFAVPAVMRFRRHGGFRVSHQLRELGQIVPDGRRFLIASDGQHAVIQLTKNVGINMMIFLAALQAVPQDLLDAARVDGAGRWARFRHVVLPLD